MKVVDEITIDDIEKNAGKLSSDEKRQRILLVILLIAGYLLIRLFQGGF